ncbi:unnamed protein product [Rotaria sordida]|uniref:Uncharacterized protein n=1 Tax=Rotaria sordida TaxID=392033 RepID=A0A815EEU7_9BILA|nr:unnamed protein product [Rotaria sordida]CAF1310478.1 unnamed protein product [Rotaria sordida]CAF1383281.1 unnamed protein product [Rotaria sordida]CAF1580126.1 unnamed protein product [Rotaria sordida]CAF3539977.1 unnamed protein product [Rotaria sordida]
MAIFLINVINANPVKNYPNHLFKQRLASLLKAKWHVVFDDKLEAAEHKAPKRRVFFHDEDQRDENDYLRRVIRDKIIGFGDDPF